MNTLQQVKDEIAQKNECLNWKDLLMTFHKGEHEGFYDKASMLYANEKLQLAADNLDPYNCYDEQIFRQQLDGSIYVTFY